MIARRTLPRMIPLLLATLLASGTLPVEAMEEQDTFRAMPHMRLAGDLTGDGIEDALSRETTKPIVQAWVAGVGGYSTLVSGRDGSDGSRLWTLTDPEGTLHPAPLGPDGANGLLQVRGRNTAALCECTYYVWIDNPYYVHALAPIHDLVVTARDGGTSVLWERTFAPVSGAGASTALPGYEAHVRSYEDFPSFGGLLQATPSAAVDTLAVFSSRHEVGDEVETAVRMEILDGATGQTAASWTVRTEGTQPAPRPVGDLDGDGLDDVVVAHDPESGMLSAYSGADGTLLWTNADLDLAYEVSATDFGDVDRDGHSELQVRSSDGPFSSAGHPYVRLLDGATGEVLLTSETGPFVAVGDTDEDDVSELVRASTQRRQSTYSATYELLKLDGTVLRTATHSIEGSSTGDVFRFDQAIGDLNGDGILEVGHHLLHSGSSRLRQGIAVDGATLERIFDAPALEPMRVSLSGDGDDFAGARKEGREVVVAAQDGATGSHLWERRFPVDEDVDMLNVRWTIEAADLDGDGLADLLVNIYLPLEGSKDIDPESFLDPRYASVPVYALSGLTGQTLWSV